MADVNGWKSEAFRSKVIAQIEENIRNSSIKFNKSSVEMEQHLFLKAKSRDEYLSYVARLILHIKDVGRNRQVPLQDIIGQQQNGGAGTSGGIEAILDPVNVSQPMAMRGSGNASSETESLATVSDQNDWKSEYVRKQVIAQIEEVRRTSTLSPSKSSEELEFLVSRKAKTREEYIALIAKLLQRFQNGKSNEEKANDKRDGGPYTSPHQQLQEPSPLVQDTQFLFDPRDAYLFNKALLEGQERDIFVRINVVGYFAQGKTSLIRRLLNQSIDGIVSTDGIDVHIRKCKVKETEWESYETQRDEDCYRRLAKVARSKDVITVQTHDLETEEKQEYSGIQNNLMAFTHTKESNDSLQGQETNRSVHDQDSITDASTSSAVTVSPIVRKLLTSRSLQDVKVNVKDVVESESDFFANIWDFGGQYIYYATHQIFHSRDAIYLLVFDLRQDLESYVIDSDFPERRQKIKNCLKFWVNSIVTFVGTNDGTRPQIIFVGTHKDLFDGDVDEKFGKVIDLFVGTKARNHIHEIPFAVSNVDTTDKSFDELRKAICELAKTHYVHRKVPAKWIPLEIALLSTREEKNILTFDDVTELAKTNLISVQDEGDLKLFLKYHHAKGTLIYFDEDELDRYIIVNPRYLIDAFKCIFTSKDVCKWKRDLHPLWKKLETTAVLERELVDEVWKNERNGQFIHDASILFLFLQRHRIISELLLFECSTESVKGLGKYLVPSMLRQRCSEETLKAFIGRKRGTEVSLGYKLDHSSVLENIYVRITAAALGRWPPIKYNDDNFLFKNTGFYRLDRRHVGQITLKEETGLELTVYNSCVPDEIEMTVCDRFRRYIESVITYDFRRLHGDISTTPFEYYFACNHQDHCGIGSKEVFTLADMEDSVLIGCPDYFDHSIATFTAREEWFLNDMIAKDQNIPDRRVTDKDLTRIAESLGKNWKLLGAKLGFPVDEIERIEMDHAVTGVATTIFYMLYQWKERNSDRDTFKVLIKTMKECEQLTVNWDKIRNIFDGF